MKEIPFFVNHMHIVTTSDLKKHCFLLIMRPYSAKRIALNLGSNISNVRPLYLGLVSILSHIMRQPNPVEYILLEDISLLH